MEAWKAVTLMRYYSACRDLEAEEVLHGGQIGTFNFFVEIEVPGVGLAWRIGSARWTDLLDISEGSAGFRRLSTDLAL
jgi:hypothetical protein